MVKAVFFDVDGTLVSFKTHRVPVSALEAIRNVRERGVKVFVATGRPMTFLNAVEEVDYDGVISTNGAYIVEKGGHVIYKNPISKDDILRLTDYAYANPLPMMLVSENRLMGHGFEDADKSVHDVFKLVNMPLPPPFNISEAKNMDILQVVAFFTKEREDMIMGKVLKGCDAYRWHPAFADCIPHGVSKATGIDMVCRHYGISLEQTMAFGDGGNDMEMLRHVGVGVAMGNAADEVKESADIVTLSVDEDGVAKALKRVLG